MMEQQYSTKSRRKKKSLNYSEILMGDWEAVCDTDAKTIRDRLDQKVFTPYQVREIEGQAFTSRFIYEGGFNEPLVIPEKDGLDLKMPPSSSFGVNDVMHIVGKNHPLNVIETSSQAELPGWNMEEWASYYCNRQPHHPILNVISLEVSNTALRSKGSIASPSVVREVDWIDQAWPAGHKPSGEYPRVQYYCLMSVSGAYTDFHIDFGGTSVWYHVLKGKKTFFLIEPTEENLEAYCRWSSSQSQQTIFLGDQVENCYKVEVPAGATFFIPSGWIHAVFTPEDSLVFGGNFMHNAAIEMQLNIYEIEERTRVPEKFRFPYFCPLMLYVAAIRLLTNLKKSPQVMQYRSVLESIHKLVAFCRRVGGTEKIPEVMELEATQISGSRSLEDMLDELSWRVDGHLAKFSEQGSCTTSKHVTQDAFPCNTEPALKCHDARSKSPERPQIIRIKREHLIQPTPKEVPAVTADPTRLKLRLKLGNTETKEKKPQSEKVTTERRAETAPKIKLKIRPKTSSSSCRLKDDADLKSNFEEESPTPSMLNYSNDQSDQSAQVASHGKISSNLEKALKRVKSMNDQSPIEDEEDDWMPDVFDVMQAEEEQWLPGEKRPQRKPLLGLPALGLPKNAGGKGPAGSRKQALDQASEDVMDGIADLAESQEVTTDTNLERKPKKVIISRESGKKSARPGKLGGGSVRDRLMKKMKFR